MSSPIPIEPRSVTSDRSFLSVGSMEGDPLGPLIGYIEEKRKEQAFDELSLQINTYDGTIHIERLYELTLQALPLFTCNQIIRFFQLLPKLLNAPSIFPIGQYSIAIGIGREIKKFLRDDNSKTFQLHMTALDFFVHAIAIADAIRDTSRAKEGHREASSIILLCYANTPLFKDQLDECRRTANPDKFSATVDRIEHLKMYCHNKDDVPIVKSYYEQAINVLSSIPQEQSVQYEGIARKLKKNRDEIFMPASTYPSERYIEQLKVIRKEFKDYNAITPAELLDFQKSMHDKIRTFFCQLIDEAMVMVGTPPVGNKIEMQGMGSFGRKGSCPFSDIEIMVLIENDSEKSKKWVTALFLFLELQVRSLGETPPLLGDIKFTAVERPKFPGFHIDANPAYAKHFIGTPERFAGLYLQPPDDDPCVNVQHSATQTALLWTSEANTSALVTRYHERLSAIFNEEIEVNTEKQLRKHQIFSDIYAQRRRDYAKVWEAPMMPQEIDLKDHFVNPLLHLLEDIAVYWEIPQTNNLEMIDELCRREKISEGSRHLLKYAVTQIYLIRLKLHNHNKKQVETIKKVSHPQEFAALERIYWLAIRPLYAALDEVFNNQEMATRFNILEETFDCFDFIDTIFHEACAANDPSAYTPMIKTLARYFDEIDAPFDVHQVKVRQLAEKEETAPLRHDYCMPLQGSPHFSALINIPTITGHRIGYDLEQQKITAQIERITTSERPAGNTYFEVRLAQNNTRYFNIEHHDFFNDAGYLRNTHTPTTPIDGRSVARRGAIHLKQHPMQPMMEFAVHNLAYRLQGRMTPATRLIKCTPTVNNKKLDPYPLLISLTQEGPTLETALQREIEQTPATMRSWTWQTLLAILISAGDGLYQNFVLSADGTIYSVDNDISLVYPIKKEWAVAKRIDLRSGMFCLFPPDTPLVKEALDEFSRLDITKVLRAWFTDIIEKEQEYNALFEHEERKHLFNRYKRNHFSPSIVMPPGAGITIELQFHRLQNYIRRCGDQPVTAIALLRQVISLRNGYTIDETLGRILAHQYSSSYAPIDTPKKRLERAITSSLRQGAMFHDGLTNLSIPEAVSSSRSFRTAFLDDRMPTFERIESGDFSPSKAYNELLSRLERHGQDIVTITSDSGEISVNGDFVELTKDGTPDIVRQAIALKGIITRISIAEVDVRNMKITSLTLTNCAALTTTSIGVVFNRSVIQSLLPFLGKSVTSIDFSNSPSIISTDIENILRQCPSLTKFTVPQCANLRSVKASHSSLQELQLDNNQELKTVTLKTPALRKLTLRNLPMRVQTIVTTASFPEIDIENSPKIHVEVVDVTDICKSVDHYQRAKALYVAQMKIHYEMFQEEVESDQATITRKEYADIVMNCGFACHHLQEYLQATEYLEEALKQYRRVFSTDEANQIRTVLSNLIVTCHNSNQTDKKDRYREELRAAHKRIKRSSSGYGNAGVM